MKKILVCGGPGCVSSNSEGIIENINRALKEHGLSKKVKVLKTGCFGFCEEGPVVKILPDNTFYVKVKPEDGERIVVEDIISEKKLTDLLYIDEKTGERVLEEKQIPFYQKQEKIALRNCGLIDPEVIEQYIEKNGYKALEKAVKYMDPVEVISTVIESGLRGRGGGGFSTGKKWEFARMAKGDVKY
ncbi:MAG: NAD(P)H-dependent oxidoreductase subunit E, partial [Cetobacterium sp.]|nr:NAD(P)H-dependent oxidoreductase subunit E [Cetobacterium sp.]